MLNRFRIMMSASSAARSRISHNSSRVLRSSWKRTMCHWLLWSQCRSTRPTLSTKRAMINWLRNEGQTARVEVWQTNLHILRVNSLETRRCNSVIHCLHSYRLNLPSLTSDSSSHLLRSGPRMNTHSLKSLWWYRRITSNPTSTRSITRSGKALFHWFLMIKSW